MTEANGQNNGVDGDIPRRSTFSPPEVEQDVPLNLGDEATMEAPRVQAPPPIVPSAPLSGSPTIPPAPIRKSLTDADILAQMGGGGNTEGLIQALQDQMELRKKEDDEFGEWEALVRQSVDEETAEQAIYSARAEFGGLPIGPAPVVAEVPPPAPPAPPVHEATPSEPIALLSPTESASPESEEIILPRFGQSTPEVAEQSLQSDPDQTPAAAETPTAPTGEFEKVLGDPDAVSPPTDAWPLVENAPAPAELAPEPIAPVFAAPEPIAAPEPTPEPIAAMVEPAGASRPRDSRSIVLPVRRFGFDYVGEEITPDNARVDKSLQLFWAWWAVGSPIVAILLGAWLTNTGLSLVEAIVASVVGVALASIPVVLGTIVGIRTGLPTLVASRAAFGLAGNVIPAVAMALVRILVAAAFLWGATWMITGVLVESNYWNGYTAIMQVVVAAVAVIVAVTLAVMGRGIIQLTLWISAGLATLGLLGVIAVTAGQVSSAGFGGSTAGPVALVAGISVVMSALLVTWAQTGSDLARFHRPFGTAGAASLAGVGAVIPPLLLLGWGALLGASDSAFREALFVDFFDTVLELAPDWYVIPAVLFLGLPLIALAALGLHSSGYAVISLGARMPRYVGVSIASAIAALGALAVVVFLPNVSDYFVELILATGVVVAAFVGAHTGEIMTRRIHLDATLLAGTAGRYHQWRIAPVIGYVVALALGFGFIDSAHNWPWLGYLADALSSGAGLNLGSWQLGPIVALVVALAFNAFAGIKAGVSLGAKARS